MQLHPETTTTLIFTFQPRLSAIFIVPRLLHSIKKSKDNSPTTGLATTALRLTEASDVCTKQVVIEVQTVVAAMV